MLLQPGVQVHRLSLLVRLDAELESVLEVTMQMRPGGDVVKQLVTKQVLKWLNYG